MRRIAIVTSFSEAGLPLLKQCIISCHQCMKLFTGEAEFTVYAYECNWTATKDFVPFSKTVSVSDEIAIDIPIVQKDASAIVNPHTILPDIRIYHDFATHHLDDFDYALFCHDDIVFNETIDLFSAMIKEVDDPLYNIIAEAHLQCQYYLSVRFYPHFIFVRTDKFRDANLSFCNDLRLISEDDFRLYPLIEDGGAGLLNSYYSRNNPMKDCEPFTPLRMWFRHLRLGNDSGIETYNIRHPDSPVFLSLVNKAEEYCDLRMYGC